MKINFPIFTYFLFVDKNFSLQVFEFAKTMHEKKIGDEDIFYINNDHINLSKNNENKDSNHEDDDFDMSEYLSFKKNNDKTLSSKKSDEGKNNTRSSCCSSMQKKDKYDWQYQDTLALIRSYGYHLDEKNHPVQKKYFWENIVNDLISQKFNVNKIQCQNKWTSLYQSYKSCKDKTGRAPDSLKFYDEIDEFLGHKPANSSQHSLGSLPKKKNNKENKENKENMGKKIGGKKGSDRKKKRSEDDEESRFSLKKAKLELAQEKLKVEKEKCELIRKYIQLREG